MPPLTLSFCAIPSSNPSLLSEHLPHRIPASEPAPRPRPGAPNLRSSAFICGLCFEEAPDINHSIFINNWRAKNSGAPGIRMWISCARNGNKPVLPRNRTRMTLIKRIFTDSFIRANPRHPYNPCSMADSLFEEAPKINKLYSIELTQQSLCLWRRCT